MLRFWFEAICLCVRKGSVGNVVHFQAFLTPHGGKSVKSRRDALQTLLSAKERLEKTSAFLASSFVREWRLKNAKSIALIGPDPNIKGPLDSHRLS